MLSHSGDSRRALHPRCRWEEWEVLTKSRKMPRFSLRMTADYSMEIFAAALALLDVPHSSSMSQGYHHHHGNDSMDGNRH